MRAHDFRLLCRDGIEIKACRSDNVSGAGRAGVGPMAVSFARQLYLLNRGMAGYFSPVGQHQLKGD